jgi:hypothetical protein
MEKEADVMQVLTQSIHIELNPSYFKIASIKGHSILSKAFSISFLRNINPYLPLLDLKEWRSS